MSEFSEMMNKMARSLSRKARRGSRKTRRGSRKSRSVSYRKSKHQVVPRSAVQKGALTRYGYSLGDPKAKRHAALRKACKHEKCKHPPCGPHTSGVHRVIKQVNLLAVWNKSRPALERKAKEDLRFVQSLLKQSKSKSRSRSRR